VIGRTAALPCRANVGTSVEDRFAGAGPFEFVEPVTADDQHDAAPELPGGVSVGVRDHHGPEEGNFSEARASYGAVSGRVNSTLLSTHQTRST